MTNLDQKHCKPCEGSVLAMTPEEISEKIKELPEWSIDTSDRNAISRRFEFKNYYQTMAFVNAIAWMAHQENHHPDLEVHYNYCVARYSTHAIRGLSENDFICAAKVDALFQHQ